MRVSDINVDGPLRVLLEWMEQRRMEAQLKALKWRYMVARTTIGRLRDHNPNMKVYYLPETANSGSDWGSAFYAAFKSGMTYAPGY